MLPSLLFNQSALAAFFLPKSALQQFGDFAVAKSSLTSKKVQHVHSTGRHHIDKRAEVLAQEIDDNENDLLSTAQVANWLGVSVQWLEIGRGKDYGPKFVRIGPRVTRYRRVDVVAWLMSRVHASTAEYTKAAV